MRLITIIIAALTMCAGSQAGPSAELRTGRHLFILSGQSNMFHMKSGSFHRAVMEAFGDDNVTVVRNAKRGAAIRNWDKDYKWPEDRGIPQGRKRPGRKEKTREEFLAGFGNLYDTLMGVVKQKTAGKTYDTVTFVWMQGESDSGEEGVAQYIESFNRVVARLKSDLKIESINIVIGRLSDYGMEKESWVKMRELQVKYAEEDPNCEWVNTDDLNDRTMDDGTMRNGLHYTEKGYEILGQRFAEKAIGLIEKKKKATP